MESQDGFIRVKEVAKTLDCSESKAYQIMKILNNELEAKNKIIIQGRVPRKYFMERLFV
jgi:predicted DNA-binding transcriptional regulator AlpA